jgi:hypothetical protein
LVSGTGGPSANAMPGRLAGSRATPGPRHQRVRQRVVEPRWEVSPCCVIVPFGAGGVVWLLLSALLPLPDQIRSTRSAPSMLHRRLLRTGDLEHIDLTPRTPPDRLFAPITPRCDQDSLLRRHRYPSLLGQMVRQQDLPVRTSDGPSRTIRGPRARCRATAAWPAPALPRSRCPRNRGSW